MGLDQFWQLFLWPVPSLCAITALDHEEANVDEFEVSFLRTKEKLASIENLSASSTVEDSLYLLFFIKKQEQSTNPVQWLVFS